MKIAFFIITLLLFLNSCVNESVLNKETKVVLLAERHDYYGKFEIQLELLKKFNSENQVRYILFEQPHTTGVRVREFFETGDSLTLKDFLVSEASLVNKDHKPLYNFYISLYEYYLSLDDNKRFNLQFIDIESYKTHNIQTWLEILRKTKNQKLNNLLDQIEFQPDSYESSISTVNLLKELCSDKSLLEGHKFKNDLSIIKQGFSIENRDSLMYIRILDLLKKTESGLIFGQFGSWHICRENDGNLINLLEKSELLNTTKSLKSVKLNFTLPNTAPNSLKDSDFGVLRKVDDRDDNCKYDFSISLKSRKGRFLR